MSFMFEGAAVHAPVFSAVNNTMDFAAGMCADLR